MEAASVCMGLLAMAQTDHATSELPRGPERSAMFVQKAEEYFKGLNVSKLRPNSPSLSFEVIWSE